MGLRDMVRFKLLRKARVTLYMHIHPFILGSLVILPLSLAAADDLAYKWVDADGVTNFSDTPPVSVNNVVEEVEPIALPGGYKIVNDPAGDYYSIDNQWKRLNAERLEREKLAMEREWARIERSRVNREKELETASIDTAPAVIYGGRPLFLHPRPLFPGHRPLHRKRHKQPAFSHSLPRKDFRSRKQKVLNKSSVGRSRGNSDLEHMRVGGLKSKCC
jgi:hypothetical protein